MRNERHFNPESYIDTQKNNNWANYFNHTLFHLGDL